MPRFVTLLLGVFLVAYMGLILWKALREPKNDFERWKNITEILAILAAGVFFTSQFLSGWTSTNMNISLKTERIAAADIQDADTIAIQVDLEKGEYGSIRLYDGEIRAIDPDTGGVISGPKKVVGTERVEYEDGKVNWSQKASNKYRIASSESLHFANVLQIPRNKACVIEAVIIGYPDLWLPWRGYSQWRSSIVSLPANRAEEKVDNEGKPDNAMQPTRN